MVLYLHDVQYQCNIVKKNMVYRGGSVRSRTFAIMVDDISTPSGGSLTLPDESLVCDMVDCE